jgi:mRNA interferase RelE/StbE
MEIRGEGRTGREQGLYHRIARETIAELRIRSKILRDLLSPCDAHRNQRHALRHIALCEISLDCYIALCDFWPVKEIVFTSAAVRQWRKLTVAVRAQIDLKLSAFAATGIGDVKALKGTAGMRLRAGDWRVLFTIKADTITIHAVGHRRDIYD